MSVLGMALAAASALSAPVRAHGQRDPWRGETSEEIDARRAKRKAERQARKQNRRRK